MRLSTNKLTDPCEECRSRHLRCDKKVGRCEPCVRSGGQCTRLTGQRKFRNGSSAKYDKKFSQDQTWLTPRKDTPIQIVDQTAEIEGWYGCETSTVQSLDDQAVRPTSNGQDYATASTHGVIVEPDLSAGPARHGSSGAITHPESYINRLPTLPSLDHVLISPTHGPTSTPDLSAANSIGHIELPPISSYIDVPPTNGIHVYSSPEAHETRRIEAEYRRLADTEAGAIPDEPLLSPARWKRDFRWPNQYTTQQCMCLFRYYIEQLGPWLDVGDPSRHFTNVVPVRARRCPPLLNAVFTASARHLRYTHRLSGRLGPIEYTGIRLPELNHISTLKYYQATISYLRVLCHNAEYARDEDLLAATVILRFYEELENLITGQTDELLSRPFQLFVAAQAKPALAQVESSEERNGRHTSRIASLASEEPLRGYQHASFRIALRQECQRALLAKDQIQLPLHTWKVLENFDDADDSVWTDRHLYHYAMVLQFCFDSGDVAIQETSRIARWIDLRHFEQVWEEKRPLSFSHYRSQVREQGTDSPLPQLWFVNEVHSLGMMYYHVSRLLLIAYDPQISRIGPGSQAATRKQEKALKDTVLLVCGIALSTVQTQPVLCLAYNVIAMFGEYFSEQAEQNALLEVLNTLQTKHGWPTFAVKDALLTAWSPE